MRQVRLAPMVLKMASGRIIFQDGRQHEMPPQLSGCAGLGRDWVLAEHLSFPDGALDALFAAGLIEIGAAGVRLPVAPRRYLAEQFPDHTARWPLENWLTRSTAAPVWLALPYESPRELAGSTAAGCARIVAGVSTEKNGVFGILPGKSPSPQVDALLAESLASFAESDIRTGIIGGDHRVTWTFLKSVRRTTPDMPVVHVQFDAHHDLYEIGETPVPVNPANFNIDLLRSGTISAMVPMGCRDTRSHIDSALAAGHIVASHWRDLDAYAAAAHWHLSIDVDILDPSICPGVTNPLPQGWSINRLLSEFKELFGTRAPDSVSIVEVTSEDAQTIDHAVRIKAELDSLYEIR